MFDFLLTDAAQHADDERDVVFVGVLFCLWHPLADVSARGDALDERVDDCPSWTSVVYKVDGGANVLLIAPF